MINQIRKIDVKVTQYMNDKLRCKIMDEFMKTITFLGNYALIWACFVLYLLCIEKKFEALSLAVSVATTCVINEIILKKIFKRLRPAMKYQHITSIIRVPKSYSFPSGHSSTSFSALPALFITDIKLAIIGTILAMLMAMSRVYLKVHYFSDVIVGAIVGTSISIAVLRILTNIW